MPDYQQMYLLLFRAVTRAIDTLVQAQQLCEERYIETSDEKTVCVQQQKTERTGENQTSNIVRVNTTGRP